MQMCSNMNNTINSSRLSTWIFSMIDKDKIEFIGYIKGHKVHESSILVSETRSIYLVQNKLIFRAGY